MSDNNSLTIKESWKAPYNKASLKRMYKQYIIACTASFCVVSIFVTIGSASKSDTFLSVLGYGVLFFLAALVGTPIATTIILPVIMLIISPFLLLVWLPKMNSPKQYKFHVTYDKVTVLQNDKVILDISRQAFKGFKFITGNVGGISGNPLGDILEITYSENQDKEKTKKIKINWIFDNDKILLRQYLNEKMEQSLHSS